MYSNLYPTLTFKGKNAIGKFTTDLATDLENWMSKLPQTLRTIPIIYLAIPGSHDSFTTSISSSSDVSLDAEEILQNLQWLCCVKVVMANWSRTQDVFVAGQLNAGIRYFDLRICTKTGEDKLYFCHSLYSDEVQSILDIIATFLETHTQEVVILDCQHFYGFTQDTHEKLMQMLTKTFGTKLCPYSDHMDHLTLDYMTSQFRYQVLTIYRSDAARFGQPLLWPSDNFPTPWPDTMEANDLFTDLDSGIKNRSSTVGYVSQCILTPSFWDIIGHVFSTLKQKCAVDFEEVRTGWISKQSPGKGGVNVVIADFIDLSDNLFPKTVINLNLKLLSDLPNRMYPLLDVVNEIKRY